MPSFPAQSESTKLRSFRFKLRHWQELIKIAKPVKET